MADDDSKEREPKKYTESRGEACKDDPKVELVFHA